MSRPVVLCVDDEKIILDSLSNQIRNYFGNRADVEQSLSVDDAMELIAELHDEGVEIRLVISDWLMHPTKGDVFLKEVQNLYPDIKLVMLSGQAELEAIDRVKRLPSLLAFVNKPWEKEHLMGLVGQALAS
jgi:DNA-binding NtrC family response regulator